MMVIEVRPNLVLRFLLGNMLYRSFCFRTLEVIVLVLVFVGTALHGGMFIGRGT